MLSIKVPPLGESITEATISRWLKNEGDAVAAGETLVELETDKITVEVPALKAGVLTKRGPSEGAVVKVDDLLGELDENAVTAPRTAAPAAGAAPSPAAASPTAPPAPPAPAAQAPVAPASPPASMPAARRLGAEAGIDLSTVTGTGRGGVVSKPDVIAAMSAPAAPAAPAPAVQPPSAVPAAVRRPPSAVQARESREKMSTRRKRIAENLLQAQHNTAHLTTFNEIDMSAIVALRERMKEKVEKEHGVKLSFMPFFAKAAIMALKAFPVVNAQIDGDSLVYKNYVNLGIAVASEAGLVVPNVKDADSLGILGLSQEIAAIAKRARDGKLTMEDLTAGTFTITNGGVFGSLISTPIINYPQSGILGLHKTQDRPIAVNGQVVIRPMMYVALSYDHRIIDGQQAVLFLVRVKELMEDPASMLID
ncbi:MAG TPA: 2-oxoglutarate dehydrogenase complex dihydrolipoyllysine-residue succinyltransferase [Gemmatimonadaceae bacterium]|jgi:2-oxoglutarate dehydrogenase E2 component (dihydrolipoamide succinyltransferase)|nr:2-oxoglutarate dehydrogenase complex dihydrolipoyllysine-residue succinyltransferase [Gemmatimonadaceae bacterium]